MRRRHLPGRPTAQGRPDTPTAVAYLRRSTDRQEQSIPDQKRAIEAYAAENGLRIGRLYIDDAISGTSTTRRKAFQELIEDAQKPGCDFRYVVVYDVKRFGRVDNDEAGYYRHILKLHGVEVLYISENFNGDATDDLLRPVKQWQAREESKDLSRVTIRGLLSKVKGGWWMGGTPPYGYDLRYENERGEFLFVLRFMQDGTKEMRDEQGEPVRTLARGERVSISKRDRAKLIPSTPERVDAIRQIFRMAAEDNKGYAAIAETLNEGRIPTPRGPQWARIYCGKWVSSSVREILLNPAYVGDMTWNRRTDGRFHKISNGQATERREVYGARLVPNPEADWIAVPRNHPPLIERRLWELARQARAGRIAAQSGGGDIPRIVGGWRGTRGRYLLSGLITCARCGGRYEGCVRRKGKPRKDGTVVKTHYYGCGTYIRQGASACRFGPVGQFVLEDVVIDTVVTFYRDCYGGVAGEKRLKAELHKLIGNQAGEVGAARTRAIAERDAIHSTLARLLDNLTETNRSLVDERLSQLDTERRAVEQRLAALEEVAFEEVSLADTVSEVSNYLAALQAVLRADAPEPRARALRRCALEIILDADAATASVRVRRLPTRTPGKEVIDVPVVIHGR